MRAITAGTIDDCRKGEIRNEVDKEGLRVEKTKKSQTRKKDEGDKKG